MSLLPLSTLPEAIGSTDGAPPEARRSRSAISAGAAPGVTRSARGVNVQVAVSPAELTTRSASLFWNSRSTVRKATVSWSAGSCW